MNTFQRIIEKIPGLRVLQNEPLAPYTTFKVGGCCELFIEPQSVQELLLVLNFLRKCGSPVFILGGGSNVVIADAGLSGAVVSTRRFNKVSALSETELLCGSGVFFEMISSFCFENELSGLEEFCGLPGTAGGAVFMNARCYEKSVSDVFLYADYLDLETLKANRYTFCETDWDYKKSPFQGTNRLILSACFKVTHETADIIGERNSFYLSDRTGRRQFDFPSAGSAFKNNRSFGAPSGKIIDEAGLCGLSCGGAQVAPWHGNFIINTGGATASDIKKLAETVIERVKEKTGFTLECEILFVGF